MTSTPGPDQGRSADPEAVHVSGQELHRRGQRLASADAALHRQARDPRGLLEGGPGERVAEQQGELRPPGPPVEAAAKSGVENRVRDAEEEEAVDHVVRQLVAVEHWTAGKGNDRHSNYAR